MYLPRFLRKLTSLALVILLCALPMGSAQASSASVICITPGSLQAAINAAAEGATLVLCAGTFYETLTINKNITLRGVSMLTTTLQPAAVGQRVITVNGVKNLVLENLKITGGQALTAENNVGGGVFVSNGSLTLTATWVTGNSAQYGGGVFQAGTSHIFLATDSIIENNSAVNHGGGAYADGIVSLDETNFNGNTAGWHGGGLYANSGNATLLFGVFNNNHATNGDGGGVGINNGVNIFGTEFNNNTAGGSGGGVSQWNDGYTVTITGVDFTGNTANVNGGGLVVVGSNDLTLPSTVTVNDSDFLANTAKRKGGGIYAGVYATLTNTQFTSNGVDSGNTNDTSGGGMYARNGINGSGLTFTANQAKCAGCMTRAGGGLSIERVVEGPSSITRSTFDGNLAGSGGGLHSGLEVQLTATYSSFINHGAGCTVPATCIQMGGGMSATYLAGDHLLFQNNNILGDGGGLNASSATLTNSWFINNSSPGNGGGIKTVSMNGTNLLMIGNSSSNGAAIRMDALTSTLQHITISNPTQQTGSAIYLASHSTLNVTIQNSIISAYLTGIYKAGTGTLVEDYNLYYNNTTNIYGGSPGAHSLIANPLFVNPAAGDYHLQSTSPAIAHGANLGVLRDLDGKPRVGHWDIGAYQYWIGVYLPAVQK